MQIKAQARPAAATPTGTDTAGIDGLMALHQRQLSAFAEAAQLLGEGTRAIMARQNELAVAVLGQWAQAPFAFQSPEEMLARQAELAQANLDCTIDGMKEITDIARDCYRRAADLVQAQIVAGLEATGNLTAPASAPMGLPKANAA